MNLNIAANQYKKLNISADVDSADAHRLVQMLLRGAISKLSEAANHLKCADHSMKGESVSKAIAIIEYLRVSLEPGGDPAFAEQLGELYSYMERRIFEANARNDEQGFVEVQGLLREVEEGWSAIPAEYRG